MYKKGKGRREKGKKGGEKEWKLKIVKGVGEYGGKKAGREGSKEQDRYRKEMAFKEKIKRKKQREKGIIYGKHGREADGIEGKENKIHKDGREKEGKET